jgi:hypothetical protein
MVAQMEPDTMQYVVCGPDNRSRGLTGCRLESSGRFDIKMSRAKKKTGQKFDVFDFILDREDGTCIALHPSWGKVKLEGIEGHPLPDQEMPRGGPRGTNGPGTFQFFINKQKVARELKFVKMQPASKAKAKSKAKGNNQ